MTSTVNITKEQERQIHFIYEKKDLNCSEQELIQNLFNEAVTANYLAYKYAKEKSDE